MSKEIEFVGIDEVFDRLVSITEPEKVKNALKDCCLLVERRARELAPKGNGQLRNSIKSRVEQDGANQVGVVYTALMYAPYVEYGTGIFAEDGGRTDVPWRYQDDEGNWYTTSGMPPHPYMRPALNENRENIKRILSREITRDD